ncbi:MAG: hypothetical protein H0U71_05665 [Gammaproteobacteria bacterium]|nr:hypothetical protein [Gammaproteobacteria bacterium]
MAKKLIAILLMMIVMPSYADVYTDVQDCLRGGSSNTGNSKASCVQSVINKEEGNQITKMFQVYSNFVSQELNSGAAGSTGGSQGGGVNTTPAPRVSPPPPAIVTPPPPPISQTPNPAPQNQGGIKYY